MDSPLHIAIIMDGNGRWARCRGLPRSAGHKVGVDRLKEIVFHASKMGLHCLTIFAFSSENWQRPEKEVRYLLDLLEFFIKRDLKQIGDENIQIKVIGGRSDLAPSIKALIEQAETSTCNNSGLKLQVAFNYGGRDEILRAIKKLFADIEQNKLSLSQLDNESFSCYLDTVDTPSPDLIIRTGGELRLSNFLLWQAAYSELYFSDKFWPDFSTEDFDQALIAYQKRDRRYGRVNN